MTQLGGQPAVTDEGDIVYLFPELQTTSSSPTTSVAGTIESASAMILKRAGLPANATPREIQAMLNYNGISTGGAYKKEDLIRILERALPPMSTEEQAALEQETDASDPTLLAEREIPFSVATDFNKLLAGGLGVLNLGGALFLGNQLGQITAAGYSLPGIYGTIAGFYPLLLGYGILFNVIPLVRNLVIKGQNKRIQERNALRKKWRRALSNSTERLQDKLKAAKKMAIQQRRLGSGKKDILYDTSSTTIEDLGKEKQKSDLSEFDKLLEKEGASVEEKLKKIEKMNDDGGAFQ